MTIKMLLIKYLFWAVCGVLVSVLRELTKSITAHAVMHPVFREEHKIDWQLHRYIDPLGIIMFVLGGIGWQKPAEYLPKKFRYKEKGVLAVALTGFVANLFLLSFAMAIFRFIQNDYARAFAVVFMQCNIAITIINLLPVPPLDMSKVLYATSPNTYFKLIQNQRIIHTVFLLLLAFNVVTIIVSTISNVILMIL